jgi:hypothetical protein
MKYRVIAVALVGLSLVAGAALAQAPEKKAAEKKAPAKKMEKPKPPPEVSKLGYFVGAWKSEGEIKENSFMPAGKMTSSDKCEWFTGGFAVVCHSTGTGPMGSVHGLGILGYSADEKKYTYHGIDSAGFAESSMGTVEGSNWTYTSDEKMGGKTVHGRYSMTEVSPTEYTFKYETSEDGQKWALVMDGKTTKAEAKAPASEKK